MVRNRRPPDPDAEQAKLDLEAARDRLNALRAAMVKRDQLEEEVRKLTTQLAQAKRRLKEAGWDLGLLLSRERRG